MSDPFVAEIRIFAGNFAPKGWALCDGQVLPISQNTALFSLLGTTYGGDGKSNFALPNLQGSAPLQAGQGNGLTPYDLGQAIGARAVTLVESEMPVHTHAVNASSSGGADDPNGAAWGTAGCQRPPPSLYASTQGSGVSMNPLALGTSGGGQPHNNLPPYLVLNFIIALQGIFPPRG